MSQPLDLDISADDSKAAPAIKRTNEGLKNVETTGAKMARTISDGLSATHAALLKGLGGIESLARGTRTASDEMRAAFLSVTKTIGTYYAVLQTATLYTVAQTQATIGLQNAYRLLRIVVSPTLFTATGLAVGYLAEEMLQAAYATGKLSQAQAFFSERNKITIKELQELKAANQALGLAPSTLENAASSLKKQFTGESTSKGAKAVFDELGLDKTKGYVDSLRDIAVAFDDIDDPLEKARKAVALFGDDAEKVLPFLNSNLDTTIVKLNEMGVILGEDGAREFAQFRSDVDLLTGKIATLAKEIGLAVSGPIGGLLAALKDPALKALLAKGGLAIGNTAITAALIPFFGSAGPKQLTAEERENARRDTFTPSEFQAEVRRLQATARGGGDGVSQIAGLQDRVKTLSGLSNQTADVKARIAELTAGIATLKKLQNGTAGLIDDILFGGKPPKLVDDYRTSLDGLNSRLSTLKGQRESIAKGFINQSEAQKAIDLALLQGINRNIAGVESQIKVIEDKQKATEKLTENEKRAAEILSDARKHELTGLGAILATYHEYVALLGTSRKANLDLAQAVVIRLRAEAQKEQRKASVDAIKEFQDQAAAEASFNAQRFQKDLAFERETLQIRIQTIDDIFDHEQVTARQSRDAQIQAIEGLNAQTLQQKLAVEAAKFGIEEDYLNRTAVLEIEQIQRRSEREILYLNVDLFNKLISYKDFVERRDAILDASGQKAKRIADDTEASVESARRAAAIRSVQLINDSTRSTFDSIKQSAGGLFDAMTAKGQTAAQAIGNFLKTTILTALKEIVTSQIAATLTTLVTGRSVSFPGGNNTGPLGGIRNALGSLGLGTQPTFGKINQPGHLGDAQLLGDGSLKVYVTNQSSQQQSSRTPAQLPVNWGSIGLPGLTGLAGLAAAGIGGLGGRAGTIGTAADTRILTDLSSAGRVIGGGTTTYPGTPPFLPDASGAGGAGGFAGMLGNLKGTLTSLGQLGATSKIFQNGIYGAKGGGLLLGGGVLAADGLRRGGFTGLAETTAGGALIGAKFGGPVGALIGAAAGAIAGTIRLFIKGAEEKVISKVKDLFHLTIDKSLATQIVAISKQNFGGNVDVALRSSQVRDLLQLYAMSTGQGFGVQGTIRAVSLAETSSGLTQNALYENGKPISFSGLPVNGGLSTTPIPQNPNTGSGTSSVGGPVNLTSNIQLSPGATQDFLQNKIVTTVSEVPRTIARSNAAGTVQNAGRRQVQASLLAPGLITQ